MIANPQEGPIHARGRAVVGIDIGKRKHSATAVSPQGEVLARLASFSNTREGIDLLESEVLQKAGGPGKTLIAMEATGHYWICMYWELTRRGYCCVVLNPIQTNARIGTASARPKLTRSIPSGSPGSSSAAKPALPASPMRKPSNCDCWCGIAGGWCRPTPTWNATRKPCWIGSFPNTKASSQAVAPVHTR